MRNNIWDCSARDSEIQPCYNCSLFREPRYNCPSSFINLSETFRTLLPARVEASKHTLLHFFYPHCLLRAFSRSVLQRFVVPSAFSWCLVFERVKALNGSAIKPRRLEVSFYTVEEDKSCVKCDAGYSNLQAAISVDYRDWSCTSCADERLLAHSLLIRD